jgi:hypothetical protein
MHNTTISLMERIGLGNPNNIYMRTSQVLHDVTLRSYIIYLHACYHTRVLGYKLACCISNTFTMTIEVDTSTTWYGDELCVVIDLDT